MSTQADRPVLTWTLALACFAVTVMGNPWWMWLWPLGSPEFHPYQLLTYPFTHGNIVHLAINMLALLSFGPALERAWGRWAFGLCYFTAAVVGGLLQLTSGIPAPTVGASASLFGLFAAYTLANPKRKLVSIFIIPVPAWFVLASYGALTVAAWALNWMPGIAHLAHLGGGVVGVLFALALPKKSP